MPDDLPIPDETPAEQPVSRVNRCALMKRLRREKRWEEADRFKNEAIREFRKHKVPKEEAREAGWAAMEQAYPPLPEPEPDPEATVEETEPEFDVEAVLAASKGNPPDLVRDILWAYENLENRKAKPEDAPSVGALSLLVWARGARNRFFEQLLPKALAAKAKREGEEAEAEDEDPGLEEVERMLREQEKKRG